MKLEGLEGFPFLKKERRAYRPLTKRILSVFLTKIRDTTLIIIITLSPIGFVLEYLSRSLL